MSLTPELNRSWPWSGSECRLGKVLDFGSIDRPDIEDQVSLIMEGGAEAFRLRRERCGY